MSYVPLGILTLQPTSSPKTKKAGLSRHQRIILGLAVPCVSIGGLIIIGNKNVHSYPHFTTWHGTFGMCCLAWMVGFFSGVCADLSMYCISKILQGALGAGSVWFDGAAFGGSAKAKRVWKYHRLADFLLYTFMLANYEYGQFIWLHAIPILLDNCSYRRWVLGVDDREYIASGAYFWICDRAISEFVLYTAVLHDADRCWTGYSYWTVEPCEIVEDEFFLDYLQQ